jgi:7-cyano-7-deazaguanine synthase
MSNKKSLVLLSGGQDSTTCFIEEIKKGRDVTALAFNYSQRHAVELKFARDLCDLYGVTLHLVSVTLPEMKTALIGEGDVSAESPLTRGHTDALPASFVPGRNAMFLSIAYGFAVAHDFDRVVTGVCETDYSGYPDCRQNFITSIGRTLAETYGTASCRPVIEAPLMHSDKELIWTRAHELGVLNIVLCSRTCYYGSDEWRHYGRGCDACPACNLRRKGFDNFKGHIKDNVKLAMVNAVTQRRAKTNQLFTEDFAFINYTS